MRTPRALRSEGGPMASVSAPPRRRTLVRLAIAAVALLAVAHIVVAWLAVNAPFGDHRVDSWAEKFFSGPVHLFLLAVASLTALARGFTKSRERPAWIFMGIAITAWSA